MVPPSLMKRRPGSRLRRDADPAGGGWLVDHFAAARVGVGAHACSLAGAMLLMLNPTPVSAAFALGLIGVGYGIVSGLASTAFVPVFVAGTLESPIRQWLVSPAKNHWS